MDKKKKKHKLKVCCVRARPRSQHFELVARWHAPLADIAFNQLGQYASSPDNRLNEKNHLVAV